MSAKIGDEVSESSNVEGDARRAGNRLFWTALLERNANEAQVHAGRLLGVTPSITTTAFAFGDPEDPESGNPGEPKLGTVAADTPVHTVAAWNGEGDVGLFLVNADEHCVARVGRDGSDTDFTACVLPTRGADKCQAVGHVDPKRRFGLPIAPGTQHVAISTRPDASAANKTVFCRPMVALQDISPQALSGGLLERLLKIVGPPRVLRTLLLGFEEGYRHWAEEEADLEGEEPPGGPAAAARDGEPLEEVGCGGDATPGPPSADKAGRMRTAAWHGDRARGVKPPGSLMEEFSAAGPPTEGAAMKARRTAVGLKREETEIPAGERKEPAASEGRREEEDELEARLLAVAKPLEGPDLDWIRRKPPAVAGADPTQGVVQADEEAGATLEAGLLRDEARARPPTKRGAAGGAKTRAGSKTVAERTSAPAAGTRRAVPKVEAREGGRGSDSSATSGEPWREWRKEDVTLKAGLHLDEPRARAPARGGAARGATTRAGSKAGAGRARAPAAGTRRAGASGAAGAGDGGSDGSWSSSSSQPWRPDRDGKSKTSPSPSSSDEEDDDDDSVGLWCDEEFEDEISSDEERWHQGHPSRYDGRDRGVVEAEQRLARERRYRRWVSEKPARRAANPHWRDQRRGVRRGPEAKDILAQVAELSRQVTKLQGQRDREREKALVVSAALATSLEIVRGYEAAAIKRAQDAEHRGAVSAKRVAKAVTRAERLADEAAQSAAEAAVNALEGGQAPSRTTREHKRVVRDVLFQVDLSPYALKEQVRGFVSRGDLNHPEPGTALHGLYAMRGLVEQHQRILLDPAGTFATMDARITGVENKRMASAVEYGGVTFKDAQATKAWFALLRDKEAHSLCPDMVTILSTASTAANTISEGMATAANAIRAHFDSVLAAETTLSYEVLYPEILLAKTTATDAGGEMGGYKWAAGFATREAFKGPYQNGTESKMRRDIQGAMRNYQTAIDGTYASGSAPNKVFSEMAALAGSQALAFLDSIAPLADVLVTTGMSEKDAWARTALYPKAFFDAIRLVRVTTLKGLPNQGGALVWGSMQTTALVAIYALHNFIDHPKIASMLALSSMQKEGMMLKKLQTEFDRLSGQGAAMDKRITVLERT
jgi:hypothetical protein